MLTFSPGECQSKSFEKMNMLLSAIFKFCTIKNLYNSPFHPKINLLVYVDVFTVFDNDNSCSKCLTILNSQHNNNIKFPVEKAHDTLAFIDDKIKVNGNGFDT